MNNFTYYNPVKIVFGKGAISELKNLTPRTGAAMVTYGGGSIKRNGVYAQVKAALKGIEWIEFGGIEPNPLYETCMKAVKQAKQKKVRFLLAVGGGSVGDATKFIAAAIKFRGGDPWRILSEGAPVTSAVPMGIVLTLPATGTEMNTNAVISRASTQEKLYFSSEHVFPVFSILDPATTCSLPKRQTGNGIIDTFVHVTEQYLTYPINAPLQDRQAESILLTLIEEGPKALKSPRNYDARANLMWLATQALNGLIGLGVPQDWATHMIGHELTAFYGLDHAQTLAIVLPGVLTHQFRRKQAKLAQYGRRVWGLKGTDAAIAKQAIARTEAFFESVGVPTRLSAYGINADEAAELIRDRMASRGTHVGEHGAIGPDQMAEILRLRK